MPIDRKAHLFAWRERGVTSIEYALLASLIAMAIVVAVSNLGDAVQALYNQIVAVFPPSP